MAEICLLIGCLPTVVLDRGAQPAKLYEQIPGLKLLNPFQQVDRRPIAHSWDRTVQFWRFLGFLSPDNLNAAVFQPNS